MERTLSIVKPDGVAGGHIGHVISKFEEAGLKVRGLKRLTLTMEQAQQFYAVHKERPFYNSLTAFMTEGPIVVMVLEGDAAITRVRSIMGATNPAEADEGTIRASWAESIERNVVHGSDSPENADVEVAFFFSHYELI